MYRLQRNLEDCEEICSGCTIYGRMNVDYRDYEEIRSKFLHNPNLIKIQLVFMINTNLCESMLIVSSKKYFYEKN